MSEPNYVIGKTEFVPYPDWICKTCGEKFGRGMPEGHVACWHIEKCDICNEEVEVTKPRDFRHRKKWPIEDK